MMTEAGGSDPFGMIDLTIDDPQSGGFGPTKHTTYRISCVSRTANSTCRHRFSDFVTLRQSLLEDQPGVVVPPLPEKKVMNRFAPEFIEKRRVMLEIFLQSIIDHPLAANSTCVHEFLLWPEALRTPVAARHAAFQLPALADIGGGDALRDASKMLIDFEAQLGKLRHHFKRLQTRQNDDGDDLHELSQGVKAMVENPINSVLSSALTPVTDGFQSLATATKKQAGLTKGTLLAKLKHHRQLALAIVDQFKGREKLSKDIDALNVKIKEQLNQSTKLAGKPGKEKQVAELEAKANDLQQKVTALRDKYARFSAVLSWELERYNKKKNVEILSSLREFAIAYTDFTSQLHDLWGGLSAGVTQSGSAILASSSGDHPTHSMPTSPTKPATTPPASPSKPVAGQGAPITLDEPAADVGGSLLNSVPPQAAASSEGDSLTAALWSSSGP